MEGLPILPSEGAVSALVAGASWLEILLQIGLFKQLGIFLIIEFTKKVALLKDSTFLLREIPLKLYNLAKRCKFG